jgi:hypothetical protein
LNKNFRYNHFYSPNFGVASREFELLVLGQWWYWGIGWSWWWWWDWFFGWHLVS